MIQITAGQQGYTILEGRRALLLILMVPEVLLQCLDYDFLLHSAASDVNSALKGPGAPRLLQWRVI